jgi:integrase
MTLKEESTLGSNYLNNKLEDLTQSSDNLKRISLLRFYAEYFEYVSLKFSDKYTKSITTLFNHVFRYFGKKRSLHEIEFREWDKFFLQLLKQCPRGSSVYLRTLKASLNKALEWELISENPLNKIKLPKRQQEEQVSLSVDELNSILEAVNNEQIRNLIKTAFFSGLRLSELINLKVKHIDLSAGFLTVGDENWITKSRRTREVALSNQLIDLFKNIIINKKSDDFLFGKTKKFPFTPDYVSRIFKKAVRRKHLDERIHFHSCRHSYITNLANSEVPLPAVQQLAGHANIGTTMKYVHVNRTELMKSVKVLNQLI